MNAKSPYHRSLDLIHLAETAAREGDHAIAAIRYDAAAELQERWVAAMTANRQARTREVYTRSAAELRRRAEAERRRGGGR